MDLVRMKLSQLVFADYNPRKRLKTRKKEQFEELKRSIESFGYVEPIIVNIRNGRNIIVGGHQRADALADMGYSDVDVVQVDLDESSEKALNLALNKISGDWDDAKLAILIDELQKAADIDATVSGFNSKEMDEILKAHGLKEAPHDDGFDLGQTVESRCQPGDLWLLGRHKLICANSADQEVLRILMGERKGNCVMTDPPYNVNYGGKTQARKRIRNDALDVDAYRELIHGFAQGCAGVCLPGAPIYVFHADGYTGLIMEAMQVTGWEVLQTLVWVKNMMTMSWNRDYRYSHEPIIYGSLKGGDRPWYGKRDQTTTLEFAKPRVNKDHPTSKPVELIAKMLENSTNRGDLVLDPFAGSGSTLIACEQLGRDSYNVELDPAYCDVILTRWETFTGETAEVRKRGDLNGTKGKG